MQRIVFNEIPVQGKHSETFPAHAKLNKKQLSEIKEQVFSETGTEHINTVAVTQPDEDQHQYRDIDNWDGLKHRIYRPQHTE